MSIVLYGSFIKLNTAYEYANTTNTTIKHL